jgi:hypothetical protein
VTVYRKRGDCLQEDRCLDTGNEVMVYRKSGDWIREEVTIYRNVFG